MPWPWLGVGDTLIIPCCHLLWRSTSVRCCPLATPVCIHLFGMLLPSDVTIRPKLLPLSFVCYETLLLIFLLLKKQTS
mgnify:CR=1 FL=1